MDLKTEASIIIGKKTRVEITIMVTKEGLEAMMVILFLNLALSRELSDARILLDESA